MITTPHAEARMNRRLPLAALLFALAAACAKEEPKPTPMPSPPPAHRLGGTVTGLSGTGLVLRSNAGEELPVSANGPFTFTSRLGEGTGFEVTVKTQPASPTQRCTVSGAQGVVVAGDVTSVVVNCATERFTVGGTVSGLAGQGLVLRNSSGTTVTVNANGAFAFPATFPSGAGYAVTVQTNPTRPWQTCAVVAGTGAGSVGAGPVTGVVVACTTSKFALQATVTGLAGTGLKLRNGAATLAVSANGTATFPALLESGTPYRVTVDAQPTGPAQLCTVSAGEGVVASGPPTAVVNCAAGTFTLGGSVVNLAGSGLVLADGRGNTAGPLSAGSASFAFAQPLPPGATFDVTVATSATSPSQTCVVHGGRGTLAQGDVATPVVECTTDAFPLGGLVTGLAGTGLVLADVAGGAQVAVDAPGQYAFRAPVRSGASYAVAVASQPSHPTQVCSVRNAAGAVGAAAVANVDVECATTTFRVAAHVVGLAGTGLVLRNSGGDDLPVDADGLHTFATPVASGDPFAVTVAVEPVGPAQACTVAGGSGTVGGGDVATVVVSCDPAARILRGVVSGLAGDAVELANGADLVSVRADGAFAFPTPLADGAAYQVELRRGPVEPWQTCVLAGAGGTMSAGAPPVEVTCATDTPALRATSQAAIGTSGVGAGLVVASGGVSLPLPGGGSASFGPLPSGTAYDVVVATPPDTPWQVCTVTQPSARIRGGDETVTVTCEDRFLRIFGAVNGLRRTGLVLGNFDGATWDYLTVNANGSFTFEKAQRSLATYWVSIVSMPPTESCTLGGTAAESGRLEGADVTGLEVSCSCEAGRDDCDGNPLNGCEVTPATDLLHCGACGAACPSGDHATARCAAGACSIVCAQGYADCDGAPATGCEVDLRADSAHCGVCGKACTGGTYCSGGVCR